MGFQKKLSAVAASAALVFSGFTPAMAAPVAVSVAPALPMDVSSLGWSADSDTANGWRGNRGYRSYRGYGYGRGYRRHRNRVDAGDVLAGVLIIGGIAAIANAASRDSSRDRRDRRYEDRDYRNDDRRSDNSRYDRRDDRQSSQLGTTGMERAISACSSAAERQAGRDARISEITAVARDGEGWRVEGELTGVSQTNFLCGATNDRVDYVQLGDGELAFAN